MSMLFSVPEMVAMIVNEPLTPRLRHVQVMVLTGIRVLSPQMRLEFYICI